MDKNEIVKIFEENKKQFIIIAGGIVLSVILQIVGNNGFFGGLGMLLTVATIGYAIFAAKKIIDKRKKAMEAQAAAEKKAQEEKAINDFKANTDLDAEIDRIFSIIGDHPTIDAFEQGIDNLIKKTNAPSDKNAIRSMLLEVLLKRAFKSSEQHIFDAPASIVLSGYFAHNMKSILTDDYIEVALTDKRIKDESDPALISFWTEKSNKKRVSFLKNLNGFAVRAYNYIFGLESEKEHQPITNELLTTVVENDPVIKSYCEDNPFEAYEKKKEWLEDIHKAAYAATDKDGLQFDIAGNEKVLDMLCYMGYLAITHKDGKDIVSIVNDLYEVIKPYCEELIERAG